MRWLLACAAAATIVAGAEVGARQYGFGSPLLYRAASAGYEMVPNQKIERLGHVTTINNIGTRGENVSPMPTPGMFRVMVLGDSVANGGTMLNDAQVFAAVASRRMTAQGCHNEVMDAAAGGWSLLDEIAWVREHGLHGAQMVVWTINYMDLDQIESTSSLLDSNPSFPSKHPPFAIWEIATRYALPRLGLGPSNADTGSSGAGTFSSENAPRITAAVRDFKTYLDRRGVALLVIYHEGREPAGAERQKSRQRLLNDLAAMNVPVFETGLSQAPDSANLFVDLIHPNAAGHERIGTRLGDILIKTCQKRTI